MFGVDFSEMMLISVVALKLIKHERLPKVARTLGHLWGRAQRYINGVKADISRDMALEELRQLQAKVQAEADAAANAVRGVSQQVEQQVQGINRQVEQAVTAQPVKNPAPAQQQLPIN